jgi:hypothetical protein
MMTTRNIMVRRVAFSNSPKALFSAGFAILLLRSALAQSVAGALLKDARKRNSCGLWRRQANY